LIFEITKIESHTNQCLDNMSGDLKNIPQLVGTLRYDPLNKEEFDCLICFDKVAVGSGYIYQDCGHQYCGQCLGGYYQNLIMNNKVLEIKCPNPICNHQCTPTEIRFILPDHLYDKYLEFSKVALINKDPDIKWCPTPGCQNAFKRKNKNSLKMECNICSYQFCFECGENYHEGITCENNTRLKIASGKGPDLRVLIWQKFNTKACPKCRCRISKNGGCNHMTCYNCEYEFCWICLKEYTDNHFESSLCSQYGGLPVFNFAKKIFYKITRRRSSGSSSDDDDNLIEKIDKLKDHLGEKFESLKENLDDSLQKHQGINHFNIY